MNCLDCDQSDMTAPAVAACTHCGGGVCGIHVQILTDILTCTKPAAHTAHLTPAARRTLCPTCATALRGHAACCPEPTAAGPR